AHMKTELAVPPGFVMGVQPIRQPVAIHPPAHVAAAMSPSMVGPYGVAQPGQGTMAASPRALQNNPMQHAPMQHAPMRPAGARVPTNGGYSPTTPPLAHQLQMTETEDTTQGSKVGRFAWFVFGAAFGIFFAFFATGFVPRLGKKEEITFPPSPP